LAWQYESFCVVQAFFAFLLPNISTNKDNLYTSSYKLPSIWQLLKKLWPKHGKLSGDINSSFKVLGVE